MVVVLSVLGWLHVEWETVTVAQGYLSPSSTGPPKPRSDGLNVPPTSDVFGNRGSAGSAVMEAAPLAALDLPHKIPLLHRPGHRLRRLTPTTPTATTEYSLGDNPPQCAPGVTTSGRQGAPT